MRTFPSRTLAIALVLVLVAAGLTSAEEAPVRLPLPDPIPASTQWYGIYSQGKKFGFARERLERRGEGAKAAWVLDLEAQMKLTAAGTRSQMNLAEQRVFEVTPPHALRSARFVVEQGPVEQVIDVAKVEAGFVGTITSKGNTRTKELGALDHVLADVVSVRTWARSKPAVGATLTVREFDVSEMESGTQTFKVVAVGEGVADGVRVPYVEVKIESSRRGDSGTMRLDHQGTMLSMSFAGTFEARLEPEDVAKNTEYSVDFFGFGVVKVDRPLGGEATDVTRLVVEARGEAAATLQSGPRQTVTRDADGTTILSLGAAAANEIPATEAEVAENLRDTVDFPTKTPRIVALAAEATAGATTPREKVERLVEFVSKYVEDALVTHTCPIDELLETRKGDCSEHALLFTTLARAAGIPARSAGGLMYMGDQAKAFGGHAWNEVVLDGKWVQVDAAWDELEVDATHVTLTRAPRDAMKQAATMGGKLSFVVKEVEVAPAAKAAGEPAEAGAGR